MPNIIIPNRLGSERPIFSTEVGRIPSRPRLLRRVVRPDEFYTGLEYSESPLRGHDPSPSVRVRVVDDLVRDLHALLQDDVRLAGVLVVKIFWYL